MVAEARVSLLGVSGAVLAIHGTRQCHGGMCMHPVSLYIDAYLQSCAALFSQ